MSTKPIQLKKNIEDCQYHQLVIEWKAQEQVLQVTLDEIHSITYQVNLNTLFNKKGGVYWGIASSTGIGRNTHKVCFDRLLMSSYDKKSHHFDKVLIKQLKEGRVYELDKINFQHDKLNLTSATLIELDKLVNLLKAHPKKYIDIYSHVHKFDGQASNKVVSEKRAMAMKTYLIKKGIAAKRIQAKGMGDLYPNNQNNTRTAIYLFEPLP